MITTINCEELDFSTLVLIDVRESDEYDLEHIPGSSSYPLSIFDPKTLPPVAGKIFVFSCRSGRRSERAALMWSAFWEKPCYNLEGGLLAWKKLKENL